MRRVTAVSADQADSSPVHSGQGHSPQGHSPQGHSPQVHSRRAAYLLLASMVLFWGGNWPVMKVALGLVPALWLTALRLLLGAAALFIAVAFSGNLSRPGRRDLLQLFSGGILQLALYMAFINMGLRFVPAGR